MTPTQGDPGFEVLREVAPELAEFLDNAQVIDPDPYHRVVTPQGPAVAWFRSLAAAVTDTDTIRFVIDDGGEDRPMSVSRTSRVHGTYPAGHDDTVGVAGYRDRLRGHAVVHPDRAVARLRVRRMVADVGVVPDVRWIRRSPAPEPPAPPRLDPYDRALIAAVEARAYYLGVRQLSAGNTEDRIVAAAVAYHDARTSLCDLRVASALRGGAHLRSIDRNGFPVRPSTERNRR